MIIKKDFINTDERFVSNKVVGETWYEFIGDSSSRRFTWYNVEHNPFLFIYTIKGITEGERINCGY